MSYPTIKKRVCDRCGKEFFETYKEWLCKDCMNELGWDYTPKTNADHIRSMTDEELAETIVREFCAVSDNTVEFIVAKTRFRLWLKQPYKEDT